MFVKRLELHGFKSFAHKTAIDFNPGVTIVVGPNGCGKSNVLDSMRWVLGETSAKSLRGAKMGDVVFRGSASLKAASFAQVNLIVNNEANYLKVDHAEVSVTRRLFSNGDSEYLINKQKGRMRDVHELFMDTGLGADGYSIIEQGQIGQMVAAKPSERRELFEEAAGISRYKARREETLRKLVRTEEDLLRLFDIVGEVERTCNSLYRQAKKAERHRLLTRRLSRLQKRLIILREGLLKEKLTKISANAEAARTTFEEANAQLMTAEAARAEATRLVEDFQRRFQEVQQERYDLQAAIGREQRRIDIAKQQQAAIDERLGTLSREMSSSTNRLSVLEQTMTVIEADLARDEQTLHVESAVLAERQGKLDGLRSEHDAANRDLARLRHELQTERAKESKVLQDQRLALSLVERLTSDVANHDAQMAALKEEAEIATNEAIRAKTEMEERRAKLKALREETGNLKDAISRDDKDKSELSQGLDTVTRSYNQAASRLQALQELEDSYEGFFQGVKEVMRAGQQNRLNGIIGVLTNVLTVPKQYETAIEVALGASLQDIITASEKDAQAAIQFLKQRNAGRATFLPLDLLHSNVRYDHLDRIMGRPGVVGLAKDLIQYDKKIEPAIERRLGNTLVVDHLRTAIGLQRDGIRNRYVSLDGELADPSGVLTGGSHQSRGLLTRSREIKTLRDEVALLDTQRKSMGEKLAAAKDRLSQNYARAAAAQAELHQEQMGEARAEKDFTTSDARSREKRNAFATAESRQMQQRVDLQKHQETAELCTEALVGLQSGITEKDTLLSQTDSQFGERGTLLSQLAEQVAAGRATTTGLRERVTAMHQKLKELRRDLDTAGTDQTQREEEKVRLAENRVAAEREIGGAEALLGKLLHDRDALEAVVSQMTQENETSLRSARESVAQLQTLQRDRNVKENALRELETQSTELRAQIDFLKQEAHDEFGMTIDEIASSLTGDTMNAESEALVSPDGSSDAADARDDDAGLHEEDEQIVDPAELRRLVNELREKISRMGAVNETAIEEYKQQKERFDFLTKQRDDLIAAKDSLTETIKNLDATTQQLFHEAFTKIRTNFQENFRRLFNGGKGDLILIEDESHPEPGIEIFAQPPGKNIGGSITLMSGGEKAMTAIGLMLALFQFRPSPICILDEIDAPLDDTNCQRLCNALKEFSRTTQFLIITHNKITMSLADTIYGVTMQEPGISKLVSVKFNDIDESGLLEGVG